MAARHHAQRLVQCVLALHDRQLVHCDLKTKHFLRFGGDYKLIDYGNAQGEGTECMPACTVRYAAPEVARARTSSVPLRTGAHSDVWALALMPPDEAERVLWTFNDTAAAFPTDVCIHDLVAAQAARTPDAVALEWQGDAMTYGEMWAACGAVGCWLRSHGVCADSVVALQLDRSLEQVVGMLGTLVAGGAYLPLDPMWPVERRRFIMEDAACKQLVAQRVHVAELPGRQLGC